MHAGVLDTKLQGRVQGLLPVRAFERVAVLCQLWIN